MKIWQPLKADCTLFRSSAFQITALIFGLIAVIYAKISFGESKAPDSGMFTAAYLSYLYQNLSRPALIAGLSLPLLGLIASHLRSIQTLNQIQAQEDQNTFSNYAKHREFFFDFFKDEQLFSGESAFTTKAYEIYALLYPGSKAGFLEPSTDKIDAPEKLTSSSERLFAECEKTSWKNESIPSDLQNAVDKHSQILTKKLGVQDRFFQPSSKLSDIAERITRLRVTHKDLFAVSNFYTYNSCSKQFEHIASQLEGADNHLRAVLQEQNLLTQVFDVPGNSPNVTFIQSDFVREGLTKFLNKDAEEKLGHIDQRLLSHPKRHEIMKELRLLADLSEHKKDGPELTPVH